MIETFYALDTLGSSTALLAALIIGFFFGLALEQAGFGSSRRLAAIFYFRDMTVLKVMFTAVITAMLILSYLASLGRISPDNVFHLPSFLGAQFIGGLIFGVGFVIGGWCPGTAAVGLASGRLDALLFLGGAVGGSILYNETYPALAGISRLGDLGVSGIWEVLGVRRGFFALLFTLIAVAAFWFAEWVEQRVSGTGILFGSSFLKGFSALLILAALPLVFLPGSPAVAGTSQRSTDHSPLPVNEADILQAVETAEDHMEPEELADRLIAGETLLLVDLRTADEFHSFHIRGAVNATLPELPSLLAGRCAGQAAVLYSNGMTHPAQARDALVRLGHDNLYLLTDGLTGFVERCLTPVSLRPSPLPSVEAERIRRWRAWFVEGRGTPPVREEIGRYDLVSPEWLAGVLDDPAVRVIDLRPQPEYNTAHVPGAVSLQVESLRGVVRGVPSMLLPADILARHFSLLGLRPDDHVILVTDTLRDATLAAMAFRRLAHPRLSILEGGFARWQAEWKPVDNRLPVFAETVYPQPGPDTFSVDAAGVQAVLGDKRTVILDARSPENFRGEEGDEARLGHIPGAVNRPYKQDVKESEGRQVFLPVEELAAAYRRLIPDRTTPVIVHCRTGHQASQAFFVLKDLLGYEDVRWYDAGWTEWSTRAELPVVK